MKLTKAQDRTLSFIRAAGAVTIDAYGCLVRNALPTWPSKEAA